MKKILLFLFLALSMAMPVQAQDVVWVEGGKPDVVKFRKAIETLRNHIHKDMEKIRSSVDSMSDESLDAFGSVTLGDVLDQELLAIETAEQALDACVAAMGGKPNSPESADPEIMEYLLQ